MPLLGCPLKDSCTLQTDPSGCEKCKCDIPHYDIIPIDFACESLRKCRKTCKNGFQLDSDTNCQICKCRKTPINCSSLDDCFKKKSFNFKNG